MSKPAGPAIIRRPRNPGWNVIQTPLSDNPFESRADVQRAVGDLFAPLLACFSPSGARVRLSAEAAINLAEMNPEERTKFLAMEQEGWIG